jgi:hypothetical protein
MNPLGTNGNSHINSIIDEKGYTMGFCNRMDLLGCPDQVGSIAGLVTVLHDSDT